MKNYNVIPVFPVVVPPFSGPGYTMYFDDL